MSRRTTLSDLLEKFQAVHGTRYDYSKVEYKSAHTKVEIVCSLHGSFLQTPRDHERGHGCWDCGIAERQVSQAMTVEELINKGRELFGDIDTYEKVNKIVNQTTKITVTCSIHGDFQIAPTNYVQGHRCQTCNESHGERAVRVVLENLRVPFEREYRIPQCRDKYPLPFDFCVRVLGGLRLIEFNGMQHYKRGGRGRKGYMATQEKINDTQRRDKIKVDYCQAAGIPLLVIKYTNVSNVRGLVERFLTRGNRYGPTF